MVMYLGWACEDHHPASQKTSLEWVCVNELSARPLLAHLCHRVSRGKGCEMETSNKEQTGRGILRWLVIQQRQAEVWLLGRRQAQGHTVFLWGICHLPLWKLPWRTVQEACGSFP